LKIVQDTLSVAIFVVCGAGIGVVHAVPKRVVDSTAILRAVAVIAFALPTRADNRRQNAPSEVSESVAQAQNFVSIGLKN
jgi:hypothetical protein